MQDRQIRQGFQNHDRKGSGSAGDRRETLTNRSTNPDETAQTVAELPNWLVAAKAAESKKAIGLQVLDLREITSFTDYFIICSVSNPRQGQAIADEVGKQLKETGELPASVEGFDTAEWILLDYGDFIVHIFAEPTRAYYNLERLWRHAKLIDLPAYSL